MSASVTLGKRNPLQVSTTFDAITATASVQKRAAPRLALLANYALPEYVGTVAVFRRETTRRVITLPAVIFAPVTSVSTVQKRDAIRGVVTADKTFDAVQYALTLQKRTAPEKVLLASVSYAPMLASTALSKRAVVRQEILAIGTFRSDPMTIASLAVNVREPRAPMEVRADVVLSAMTPTVTVLRQGAPQKSILASIIFSSASFTTAVLKGAAMPPGMVTGLMLVLAGHTTLTIMWVQPDVGTGQLMFYEFSLDGGSTWVSTMNVDTEHTITGLMPNIAYSITVRAVSDVGRGPASAPLSAMTLDTTVPSSPRFVLYTLPGGNVVDLSWAIPQDDGGEAITSYEVLVTDPNGQTLPVESTGSAALSYRVRGLRVYQRYGFQVRARNSAGVSPYTDIVYATPVETSASTELSVQQLPLLDVDRQSLIVRLGAVDCRIHVWWQPSDSAWYGSLEAPVNTATVTGRRLAVNTGLLDRLTDVLTGNIVCLAIDDDSAEHEPGRDAWRRQTHGLFWLPN